MSVLFGGDSGQQTTQTASTVLPQSYLDRLTSATQQYQAGIQPLAQSAQAAAGQFVTPTFSALPSFQQGSLQGLNTFQRAAGQAQQGLLQQAQAQQQQLAGIDPAVGRILQAQAKQRALLQGNPLQLQAAQAAQQAEAGQLQQANAFALQRAQLQGEQALQGANVQNQNLLSSLQLQALPLQMQQGLLSALAGLSSLYGSQQSTVTQKPIED